MYRFYTKNLVQPPRCISKILLMINMALSQISDRDKRKWIMRANLTTVLLITAILQVSASSFAQKISLQEKNASLNSVFDQIRKQSGYDFFFARSILKDARPVSISVENQELDLVLKMIFEGQPFDYSIKNRSVVVSAKEKSMVQEVKDKIGNFFQQQVSIIIYLKDAKGNPLPGGAARIVSTRQVVRSNEQGVIVLQITKDERIQFSYIGYKPQAITMTLADAKSTMKAITVTMEQEQVNLEEVAVVSTGLQDLPKERSTGSFEVITAKQLQHSNDPNLIRRLEGITTSIVFNNQNIATNSSTVSVNAQNNGPATLAGQFKNAPLTNMTIRGRSSLNDIRSSDVNLQNMSSIPLVVIDGIANPYSIDLLNPDDVESVTILKDAAAASIWGSRAANGVIVVKTKKGRFNSPTVVSFNSNLNVTEKLDLFYKKTMSVSDYIDAQMFGYNERFKSNALGLADPTIDGSQNASFFLSPVAELMNQYRRNKIKLEERDAQINALRGNDIRRDYDKYLFRNSVGQAYSLSISGGSKKMNYNLSGGYNKNINNTRYSGSDRISLGYNMSMSPVKNLLLSGSINYNLQRVDDQASENRISGITSTNLYPYTRLADDQGNPLETPRSPYRPAFIALLESVYPDLLSMRYKPLEDIKEGYQHLRQQNVGINLTADYAVLPWLSANVIYNYNKGNADQIAYYSGASFRMREIINQFTSVLNKVYTRIVPLGGMYSPMAITNDNQTLRGVLNVNKNWNDKHEFSMIAGTDIAQVKSFTRGDNYYGYNPDTYQVSTNMDFKKEYPLLINSTRGNLGIIPNPILFSDYNSRTLSVFSNAAYTYDKRYTVSASVRKDGNSEFGEGTNLTGTPFYSFGAAWNINNEKFYHLDWLPSLRFRATFGYNGNTNPLTLSKTMLDLAGSPETTTGFYSATGFLGNFSVNNRNLRPETTGQLNLAVEFGFKGSKITGSLEYYDKRTTDLLASNRVDPSYGYKSIMLNTADLHGSGLDFALNSSNYKSRLFSWNSTFLFSYNRVKVDKLYTPKPRTVNDVITAAVNFDEGYDLSRIFAFRWAGLDPATGDPRGYLNGQVVTIGNTSQGTLKYLDIGNQPLSEARFMGSSVPVYYGALRNSFTYAQFTVSVNILYKLGYYFRRPVSDLVQYGRFFNFGVNQLMGAEYAQRWQNPGDELKTNVPSMVYTTANTRDFFYQFSDINVVKGDHVRLQELNLAYQFGGKNLLFLKNPRVYCNIPTGDVILWRANKFGLDPDILDYPRPKTYSFGFSASF